MIHDATGVYYSYKELADIKSLCAIARQLDDRHVFPATSGNLSVRTSETQFLITRSGYHKKFSTPSHFLRIDVSTAKPITSISPKPSDETKLHATIYELFPKINSVLHCHVDKLDTLRAPNFIYQGHELLKALGFKTHSESFSLPIFKNSQDMKKLAIEMKEYFIAEKMKSDLNQNGKTNNNPICAVHLEKHGIYCFGTSPQNAMNILEVFLYL